MAKFDELRELGLDDNEIGVYLACLSEGGTNVKDISKKSGLIRTTVYGVLSSLIKKGLVSSIDKESIKFFRAASPKELLNILDERKKKVSSIVSELDKIRNVIPSFYNIEFFEGKNAVKTITNDTISAPNQVVKIIGAGKKWLEFSESFALVYYRKKKEANVKTHTILTDSAEEREFMKNKDVKNSEFRFLKEIDTTKIAIFIYRDKVAFVSYEDNPRGFIIRDKEFNEVQNVFFDAFWKLAKK
jgi:sugar-specific transcriptional regulator TrmB